MTAEALHPKHYAGNGTVDCMDAMESMLDGNAPEVGSVEAYWQASTLKYLWRYSNKGGLDDLHKANVCLMYLIEYVAERIAESEAK